MSSARIRVVFFDVHDTLIYCRFSPPQVFTQLCQEAGVDVPLRAVEELYPTPKELEEQLSRHEGADDEFWLRFNIRLVQKLGIAKPALKLAQQLTTGFKEVRWWDVYPDVKPVLNDLQRAGYPLGAIANARSLIKGRLTHLQLSALFQAITYSEEAGFKKPHPQIFRIALERMGCIAQEAVHIGDRLVEDVQGARGVGIRAILLDREDSHSGADCERIRSLTQLRDLLCKS